MRKFLSLPLTLVIIKPVIHAIVSAIIGTSALSTSVPLASAGHQATILTDAPFIAVLSHTLPLTPPRPLHSGRLDPRIALQFLLPPLAALIHLILDPTDHATETVLLFQTRMTQTSTRTSRATGSLIA